MEKQIYTLGALKNNTDNRDIHIAQVHAPRPHPSKNITDVSMLVHEDQKDKGTCVGQGEGKGQEFRDFKETGKVTRLSKRFIYTECKKIDGFSDQGTYPRIAAKVLIEQGTPKEELVPDNNDLSYTDYLKTNITPEIKTEASARRVKGYAFCYTLDDVKTAIDVEGVMNASMMVGDWSKMPLEAEPSRGGHRQFWYGYEDTDNNGKPDTKIYTFNSWGDDWGINGDGWFWWSEYKNDVSDMMVYTDIPNAIIDYTKAQQFLFTRVLHIGMTGTDVLELQKRLSQEIASDGQPCYSYKINGALYFGTYFGKNTEDAVKRYQASNGLVNHGDYKTTGYGQIGPKTRAMLNVIKKKL